MALLRMILHYLTVHVCEEMPRLIVVHDSCRLIECTALARLSLTMAQKKALHASLDENLKHPAAAIQSQAAVALCAFCNAYISKASPEALARTTVKHLQVSPCTLCFLRFPEASIAAKATSPCLQQSNLPILVKAACEHFQQSLVGSCLAVAAAFLKPFVGAALSFSILSHLMQMSLCGYGPCLWLLEIVSHRHSGLSCW